MDFKVGTYQVRVNTPTVKDLHDQVRARLSSGQGFAMATLNLDHLVKLRTSKPFQAAYAAQDIVVADGNPIVWLSKIAGKPVELIPGSDAIIPLCRIAAQVGAPVGLVGSTDDTLKAAAEYLERQVEGLKVVSTIAPPFGFDPKGADAEAILKELQSAGVRLCFIALGAPKQEEFAAKGRDVTPEIGFASIGAGLDFFSGAQERAPAWVRKIAMEWLWRTLGQPARMVPRYAKCFGILPGHALRAAMQRMGLGR
ncbi:polymer biosynthesis protein, WecB/TagA/CpsF family [Thalassococcus halodurans]|uniref:Polymer biosynthesis protein, WecB/TagA/CpsF family n=1 Tax=Thalassococcus halodurans TaxID=373675 RepID=A0A1H5YYA2_9RHOB|nr:WecB/TagA/CpsF family glycosyltransferase [Thalassococcus halodurans]SEG28415.1 polymer biosynthesis protein, WecB/TagA/CpsF family [Thalassococcus halodurans]